MARVRKNMAMQGLTGLLGDQLLIRTDKAGRTIVGARPTFNEGQAFTPAQVSHHEAFRDATTYAKGAKGLEVYVKKAAGTPLNSYNVAVGDWLNPPEVKEVDLSDWDGTAGKTIRVLAVDDVQVTQVEVSILDARGEALEHGPAAAAEGAWWTYTTTADGSNAIQVQVVARDLPGHTGQKVLQR
ncbi:MAG: hypothetical protein HYZ25_13155 [Chloroflexi bacterium]|nr:hypothetical protein [Chloroflexota bacterium]